MNQVEKLTLELAEAKLISSLAHLVWIIPTLIIFENLMAYFAFNSNPVTNSGMITILTTVLWVVVVLKIINVVDQQINADRERRIQIDKLLAQQGKLTR